MSQLGEKDQKELDFKIDTKDVGGNLQIFKKFYYSENQGETSVTINKENFVSSLKNFLQEDEGLSILNKNNE